MFDYRRIRSWIRTSYYWIRSRIQEDQKHMDLTDPDPQHWYKLPVLCRRWTGTACRSPCPGRIMRRRWAARILPQILSSLRHRLRYYIFSYSVPDPGSGAFLNPGSGMGTKSRSGSEIRNEHHNFENLKTIFWVKITFFERIRTRDPESF